jgi:Secretion system C-terminal sorting domain
MKKTKLMCALVLFFGCIQSINKVQAQVFGNGSAGNVTLTGTYTPFETDVNNISGNVIEVGSLSSLVVGDQILLIQLTGKVATTNNGNWNRAKITSINGGTNEITVAMIAPSTAMKSYDFTAEIVRVIKLDQYNNVTINGTLSPLLGNAGIICLLAKGTISFNPSSHIDVRNFGGSYGDAGYGGLPNLTVGTAGLHNFPATNGGNSGTGGTGAFGGGNGGGQGSVGGSPIAGSFLPYRPSSSTTVAKNASITATKRFVIGDGGNSGNGGKASNGGAGGGGGSDVANLFDPTPYGTNGIAGTIGSQGPNGGLGSNGAGLVFLFTNEITSAATGNEIIIKANNATIGNAGAIGGNGGNGGYGAGRDCFTGGGGGGGNGGNGGNGSNGGSAGAGGAVYAYRNTVAPIGGLVTPIANYVNNGIALGGAGGSAGAGGVGGNFGKDENTTAILNCSFAGITCSSENYLSTALSVILTTGPGIPISSFTHQIGGGIRIFERKYAAYNDSTMFYNFQDHLDCNGTPYSSCDVHVRKMNLTYNFKLYSNTTPTFSGPYDIFGLFGFGLFWNPNTPAALAYINDNSIVTTGSTWVHDCYAALCKTTPASPGLPGVAGIAGIAGEPGVIDEDFFTGSPLAITVLNFTGKATNNNQVLLHWETINEVNFSHFDIERSNDGVDFKKIGSVNFTAKSKYDFLDENPFLKNYYRLKQIDIDGKFEYSKIIRLNNSKISVLVISPNPAANELYIDGVKNNTQYFITDMVGRIVLSGVYENNKAIAINKLPSAVYFLKINNEVYKFVKQ